MVIQNLRVRFPDNKTYEVPETQIDHAISLGGEVVGDNLTANPLDASIQNSPNSSNALNNNKQNAAANLNDIDYTHINHEQPEQTQGIDGKVASSPQLGMLKVRFPDNKTYEVPEKDLQKATSMGGKVVKQEEDSIGRLAARSAKTVASEIVGSLPDLATSVYNIPATLENAKNASMKENNPSYFTPESPFPEKPIYSEQKLPIIPSVASAVDSSIDKATNDYTKTKEGDSLQSGLRLASAVATPGGVSKLAGKLGQKGAEKVLGALGTTNPVGLSGAAATGAATEEASKAGYGTAASVGLGLTAGGALGTGAALAKSLNAKLALAKLTGNSPKNINLEAVDAAAAAGLDIPNTIANESKSLAHVEQVISKAPYFGTKYAKKLSQSDKDYANKVQEAIKSVGEKLVDSESSLDMGNIIKDALNDVKTSVINEKDELYQLTNSLLPEGASQIPTHTIDAISKIRNNTKTLVPSPDQTSVLSYLDRLENGIVLGNGQFKTATPVPVEMLVGSKISLNDIINWDVNASGSKKQLRMIQAAIKEDLKEYGKKNPKWYSSFTKADEFYGKYLGDEALGSETLKKIFAQEDPEKILPNLNKISDFKFLVRIPINPATHSDFIRAGIPISIRAPVPIFIRPINLGSKPIMNQR
jgi:hypothetical protein